MAGYRFFRLMLILAIGSFLIVSNFSCSGVKQSEEQNTEEDTNTGDDDDVLETYKKTVNLICSNNVTPVIFDIPFEITTTTKEPVTEGVPVELTFTGIAYFPAELLNMALNLFPGLTVITLNEIKATIIIRSGATGGGVTLDSSIATPTDIAFPKVTDSVECAAAGLTAPCALEAMQFELSKKTVTLTPGAAGSNILVGLYDSELPPVSVIATDPAGPNGIRVVLVSIVQMGLECYMGKMNDNGTPGNTGDDFAELLTDEELLPIPVN